jgi:hypothetical protein
MQRQRRSVLLAWREPRSYLKYVTLEIRREAPYYWWKAVVVRPITVVVVPFVVILMAIDMFVIGSFTLDTIVRNMVIGVVVGAIVVYISVKLQYDAQRIAFYNDHIEVTGIKVFRYADIIAYDIIHEIAESHTHRALVFEAPNVGQVMIGIADDITDAQIEALFSEVGVKRYSSTTTATG